MPGARAREVVWTTVQAHGLRVRLAPRGDHAPDGRRTTDGDQTPDGERTPGSDRAVRTEPTVRGRGTLSAPGGPTAPGRCPFTAAAPAVPSAKPSATPLTKTPATPLDHATPPRPAHELRAAADRHADWTVRHGLLTPSELPGYRAYALHELIGHAFPRARGAELDLLVDMLGWFTILDDRFDGTPGRCPTEARAVVDPLIAVLDGRQSPSDDQLLSSWQGLWERQTASMSPTWRVRAAREWRACLATFPAEADHRARGTVPAHGLGLADTMRLRRHGSCLYPFMNILERVHGSDAPAALHAEPALHRLRANTADAATLINDLYSLEREERQTAAAFNTVLTLQRARGCTRSRAVRAVRDRVARLRRESEELRRELRRRHPEGRWYLDGTRELVAGVQAWTSTSDRYVVPDAGRRR